MTFECNSRGLKGKIKERIYPMRVRKESGSERRPKNTSSTMCLERSEVKSNPIAIAFPRGAAGQSSSGSGHYSLCLASPGLVNRS